MTSPENIENLIQKLPDAESARRFYDNFAKNFPREIKKLNKNPGLLSDVLTIASFSPLLATTMLQNPKYISWLNRQRFSAKVRGKDEILESLARFALTNSSLETSVLLSRFRRRELLRIYLRDIRNLGTIAEITEEISNLADAILEYALRIAEQNLNNRYGIPLETDEKERTKQAGFCIVALGKLGSKELNYASDIDLLFLYSANGATSGQGSRGEAVTNREYFVKLAESVTKIVGGQIGEGAAYRVDLRLRPNGRVGALAISESEAVGYYQKTARAWERQVLIRSRACAGNKKIFYKFFQKVESNVFSKDTTAEDALENVRLSKERINTEKSGKNFNVKLGKGGIREIEFVAQALQLAYGGSDEWLRAPHTLISLSRLADRKMLSETELTELFEAYNFLRQIEHILQMENGLQTHTIPNGAEKLFLLAKRMNFADAEKFENALEFHTENVYAIFTRIFGKESFKKRKNEKAKNENKETILTAESSEKKLEPIFLSLEKSDVKFDFDAETVKILGKLNEISPHFAETVQSSPRLILNLPNPNEDFGEKDYQKLFFAAIEKESNFANELSVLRKMWSKFLLEIVIFDVFEKLTIEKIKILQTKLAEGSVETAILITKRELERRFSAEIEEFPFAVLGLGKLGGGGLDYGSDLDLILIYDDEKDVPVSDSTHSEFYARAAEIFVTTLSSLTRDGLLYRVDLRLRPDGKNGASVSGKSSFLNYLENRAMIWEWLAYVKLRGAAGDADLAKSAELEAGKILHQNARKTDIEELREETSSVRNRLEKSKSAKRGGKEIDIKFGEGGMLDVYFAVRFLQLRDNLPDVEENRSTIFTLEKLFKNEALSRDDYQNFSNGYRFISELDHNLRLTIGRSTLVPLGNQKILQIIVGRMKLESVSMLLEKLTFHRLNIRESFDNILNI